MVLGKPDLLPPVINSLNLDVHLLKRVVGTKEELEVTEIKTNELLMLNVGTATTVGMVSSATEKNAEVKLKLPVCADNGARVAISRRIGARWRLIGYGIIV
jgi:translation initiation factor 2 subunit 3